MWLEVKPLWCALLLLVQDVLFGLLEVLVGDLHPALPKSHEPSLSTDGLERGEKRERDRKREREKQRRVREKERKEEETREEREGERKRMCVSGWGEGGKKR